MDSSHLEKMGGELKCPICLCLLNSAVSLTCNHVFCNLCIEKSMKSASNCPVCKVPYRRREVRPAPHMDNLVSIYKSMEVASGVNIFVTQTVPSNKLSGGENQPEADMVCENGKTSSEIPDPRNKRKLKRNSSKGSSKKPSFPTKKRVQVPQHPLPETPTHPAKHEVSLGEHTKTGPQRSSVIQKDVPDLNKKEELEFCPFFWLRDEEDADKCSQPTDGHSVMDTPPVVPCFSDIKDSDDEIQCNMTPDNGLSIASHNAADLFDSDMFEWTQRACSPELCSSPMKMQVEETDRFEVILEEDKAGSKYTAKNMERESDSKESIISEKRTDEVIVDLATSACPGTIYIGNEGRPTRLHKRCKKASKNNQNKRAKRTKGTCIDSKDVAEDKIQEGKLDNIDNPGNASNLKGKPNKNVKKVSLDPSATETLRKNDFILAEGEKSLNQGTRPMLVVDFADSLDDKYGISKGQNMKKASKSNQNKRERGTKGICIDSKDEAEDSIRDEELHNIGNPSNASNLKVKPNKRVKKVCLDPCVTQSMPEIALAEGTKPQNQGNRPMLVVDLSSSLDDRAGISGNQNLKSTGNNSNTIAQQQRDCSRRSKPPKLNTAPNIIVQNQSNNGLISNSLKSCTRVGEYKVSDLGAEGTDNDIGSMMDSTCGKKLKASKKVTFFATGNSKVVSANNSKSIYSSAKEAQSIMKLQGSSDDSSKMEENHSNLNRILRKCETTPKKIQCLFCQCMEDSEASGVMVHYLNGKPVTVDYDAGTNVLHVHRNCAEWAPNVYFEDDNAINLEAELTRSKRIKCSCCGLKGAALGCYEKSCRRSFHVPCAKLTPQCRWDYDNFVMLCPLHASLKLPNEVSGSRTKQKVKCLPRRQPPPKVVVKHDNSSSWNSHGLSGKLVLCCSALTVAEKETVTEFERLSGVTVLKNWDSSVTHIIASADENGACRRTLKFLMGILEGKWILSIEWVKACLKAMENVDEQNYEIDVDIHGIRDGPRNGRLRLLNKQPKLLDGYKFYFTGDFQPSYKGYLHDLVIAAGGTVLQRKPISGDNKAPSSTFIIYSLELPDKCKPSKRNFIFNHRRSDAETLATSCQGLVATNSWILNSIAACKLQSFA